MKKALIGLAATFVALSTNAQGLVLFDTLAVDFKTVFMGKGIASPPPAGTTAQLVKVEPGGGLTPLTPTTTFFGADVPEAARYYTLPVEVAVPGVASGTTATLIFRVSGTDNGVTYTGETAQFTVTTGGGLLPAANLDALTGGSIVFPVPEPSAMALAVFGAAAWLFRRRS